MANTLIFVDLPVSDTFKAQEFYAHVFPDWAINQLPPGEFHQIVPPEGLHLGLYNAATQHPAPDPKPAQPSSQPGPRTYILVDDAPQGYLERALEHGATLVWDELWWDEFGGFHVSFYDPWGNQIVVWDRLGVRAERLGVPEDDVPRGDGLM